MSSTEIINKVRSQYEDYPYPHRDPEDERKRLYLPWGGATIEEINHYCFAGKESFENIRILVAGAGTGDAVIHLAEQLRHLPGAMVIYLDMAQSSYDVARARARIRGLENIEWHLGSLLDLPGMALQPVDFINCSGVLHHLPDPEQGLRALASVLKPGGGINLMVYATYGRHAIYHAQNLFRDLLPEGISMDEEIQLGRQWLDAFPGFSFMKMNLHRWKDEISTDIGFLDMLLHNQDRSYTVDEVYDLAENCGFRFIDFVGKSAAAYKLQNIIPNPGLLKTLGNKTKRERQSLAERIFCNIPVHTFYISQREDSVASLEDLSNTIVLAMALVGQGKKLHDSIMPGQTMKFDFKGQGTINLPASTITKAIFSGIEKQLSIGEILQQTRNNIPGTTEAAVKSELVTLFTQFNDLGLMYLKDIHLPPYPVLNYGPA